MSLAEACEEITEYKLMRVKGVDPQQHRQEAVASAIEAANEDKWAEHCSTYLAQDMFEHYVTWNCELLDLN